MRATTTARKYVVIGWQCWGGGSTEEAAMKNCRRANGGKVKTYLVYTAPADTFVDDTGNLCYNECDDDQRPKLIKKVRDGKAVPLT